MNSEKLNRYYELLRKDCTVNKEGKIEWKIDSFLNNQFVVYSELIYRTLFENTSQNLTIKKTLEKELLSFLGNSSLPPNWITLQSEILEKIDSAQKKTFIIGFGLPFRNNLAKEYLFKEINLKQFKIKRISYRTFDENFGIDFLYRHYIKRYEKSIITTALHNSFLFFEAEVEAIDGRNAMDIFEYYFGGIQSAVNISNSFNKFIMQYGARSVQALLLIPDIYVLKCDSNLEEYSEYIPNFSLDSRESSIRDIKKSKIYKLSIKILRKEQKKVTDIEKIFLECLNAYNKALLSGNRGDAFLNYWRVLEFATGSKDRKNYEAMNLIRNFFADNIRKDIGDLIVSERNSLVHLGRCDEHSDNYINWVKEYAEASIHLLIWLIDKKYENKNDLECFFSILPLPKKSAQKYKKMISQIQNDRNRE